MTNQDNPLLIDLREAARLLGFSERKVWQLQKDGDLPSLKIGRNLRFCISSLRLWVQQQMGSNQ